MKRLPPNRIAIVTGASRGIGAATARLLGAHGYAVAVNYLTNATEAHQVVIKIEKLGGHAIAVQGDMGKEADILHLFEKVDREFGPVTALVNNAAVNHPGEVEHVTWKALEEVFRANVFGVFIACREAVKRMKQNGGGAIVNVSSQAAIFGGNRMTPYAASKAALNSMLIGFAREVAPHHIRVNAVSPAIIDTDAHKGVSQERLAHLNATLPMGRMGTPEEAAQTIAWLLSDDASYISGAVLPITGAR